MADGISKIDGFNTYAPYPTDKLRGVHTNIAARDALSSSYRYEGLLTYVIDSDGANNGALYMLIDGITNSDWVKLADINGAGSSALVIDENKNSYTGIQSGTNIFVNTKESKDVIVQVRDENGNVLNFNPQITDTEITLYSGQTLPNATLVII